MFQTLGDTWQPINLVATFAQSFRLHETTVNGRTYPLSLLSIGVPRFASCILLTTLYIMSLDSDLWIHEDCVICWLSIMITV